MNKLSIASAMLIAASGVFPGAAFSAESSLAERFANPPPSSKVQCWWHWCGDNVSEKGIAADLKAMSELDIGTAHIFSANMMSPIPGYHVGLLTPEWKKLFAFTVAEAKKYGIRLGFHNCPGWSSSGGPWIKPEDSMKVVVSSAIDIVAGEKSAKLPQPMMKKDFYRDIAVFAFPVANCPVRTKVSADFDGDFTAFAKTCTPVVIPLSKGMDYVGTVTMEYSEAFKPGTLIIEMPQDRAVIDGVIECSADGNAWTELRKLHYNFYADVGGTRYLGLDCKNPAKYFRVKFHSGNVPEWMGGKPFDVKLSKLAFTSLPMVSDVGKCNSSEDSFGYKPAPDPKMQGVNPKDIVMLSAKPAADGTIALDEIWNGRDAKGGWMLLRVGYTTTGKTCAPATLPGLECDKLSKSGLDAHWPNMPQIILDTPGAKDTVGVSIIDSFEAGGQNWTETLPQEFKKRRGYDMMPYLPAVAGYTVGTAADTQKFLFDYQQTISDLFAENYFDYFAERCHKEGLEVALESYGGPFDDLRCFRNADIPTGEFWLGASPHGSPRLAASAGHLNGRAQIGAESFTTEAKPGRWQLTPYELKVSGDRGWLEGISQIVYHSYVSQPFMNVKPGLSLERHGSQFNRHTTWWKEGKWWSDYVHRGQFILQAGKPVTDMLILRGVGRLDATGRPEKFIEKGYTFDFCSKDDVLRLETKDGKVFIPGEEAYQFLYLGWDRFMTIEVLEKIKSLLEKGANICGGRPAESPSLADDPAKWTKLADEIWSEKYKTLVPCGDLNLAEGTFKTVPAADSKGRLGCLHRRIEGRDFFFVMNDREEAFDDVVKFNATGFPTLWDAKSGKITRLALDDKSTKLKLAPRASAFIGFVSEDEWKKFPEAAPEAKEVVDDISKDWTVKSFTGSCPPKAPKQFAELASWAKSDDAALKYFAGRAVYEKEVKIEGQGQQRMFLDLGDVYSLANVYVNDKFIGCLWEKPYRIELPADLPASFNLKVEVVNTWPNRLIGDAIARKNGAKEDVKPNGTRIWVSEDKPDSGTGVYTWSNFDWGWTDEDEPIPAGLIGPVKLLK